MQRVLVTGGAGFIGSHLIRKLQVAHSKVQIVNVDNLTYAGNLATTSDFSSHAGYTHENFDIKDQAAMEKLIGEFKPEFIFHLAAESHVDRSIDSPVAFMNTNILGSFSMLEAARKYFAKLPGDEKDAFRYVHVSTDEVYGALGPEGHFDENSQYAPNSPYSASKAASDHLARAWFKTYKLPVLITNCSNNYGPYQFPEKLIPLTTLNAFEGKDVEVYGDGSNVRDWLHVEDHVDGLYLAATKGKPGEVYLFGGGDEVPNIEIVKSILQHIDSIEPLKDGLSRESLIKFVRDRPGHDFRYSIDARKAESELGWKPKRSFKDGIQNTVSWYIESKEGWCKKVLQKHDRKRLGIKEAHC